MSHRKQPRTPGGIRLRALREAAGRTQLELELDASLGIGYLQRLELGKVQHPERETLERILTALDVGFSERREILGLFGYTAALAMPTEAEIQAAVEVFQAEINQDGLPVYLLDCAHRLLTWNAPVTRLFGQIKPGILMPRLIYDAVDGIAAAVLNAESFFSAQMRILHYEMQRWNDDAAWYSAFVEDMRQYAAFDHYWIKTTDQTWIPIRPTADLKLDTGRGLANFRLICETFAQDPRFRVIYYLPTDAATMMQLW